MEKNYINGEPGVLVKQRVQTNIRKVVLLAIAFTLLISPSSFADSVNNSANTLKVSPIRTDIEIAAGSTKTVQTTVSNLTKTAITIQPIENDFVAGDERGTPALILDANKFAPTHSLKRFMKPLSNVTISAGQAKTINVVIAVPKDAQAGGYFGAIRFAPAIPGSGGQVNLNASVASIILLTVPGDTVEKLNLTKFDITQNGKADWFFQSPNDLQTSFRLQNSGNVQMGPFGKISVKQGDKVVYEADFNTQNPRDMVLPDSARKWEMALKNIGSFGQYTVVATFSYGKKNETIEVTKSFWVVPLIVIIGTAGVVVVLILLIIGIWLFLRGYKRRIVNSHSRGRYRR